MKINRDVQNTEISRSFRGILRVSPDDNNIDVGISDTPTQVTDSLGNETTIAVSTDQTTISNVNLTGKCTLSNNTTFPLEQPMENDMIIGSNGNYVKKNLTEILNDYFEENSILEQLVPVGTILYIAMSEPHLSLLPQKYQGWYDFCFGQSVNTENSNIYSTTNYPSLSKLLLGVDYNGNFNLPDLRNTFIKNYSNTTINVDTPEGIVPIPSVKPLTVETPQISVNAISGALGNLIGSFVASTYQASEDYINSNTTGCFTAEKQATIMGHRKYNGSSNLTKFTFDGGKVLSSQPEESRPYCITLVPIIKIR